MGADCKSAGLVPTKVRILPLPVASDWFPPLGRGCCRGRFLIRTQRPQPDGQSQKALFEPAFLDSVRRMKLSCDIDAVPEGTVVFPHQYPAGLEKGLYELKTQLILEARGLPA